MSNNTFLPSARLRVLRGHIFPDERAAFSFALDPASSSSSSSSSSPSDGPASIREDGPDRYDPKTFHHEEIPKEERIGSQFTVEQLLKRPRKFKLPNGTTVEIQFRRYVEGADDEQFQKLDAMCKQGAKTQLESVFFLKRKWELVQNHSSEGFLAVNTAEPDEMVATSRSFRKWALLNGREIPVAYHFLLRVAPKYRGSGLGEFIERVLLTSDYQNGIRYVMGYSIEDNLKSLAMQDRIVANRPLQEELKRLAVCGFFIKTALSKLKPNPAVADQVQLRRMTCYREQVQFTKKMFARAQLLPTDIHNIFKSVLSEGTVVATFKGSSEPIVSFSIWNGGEVRSSKLPSTTKFLEKPCTFYNFWRSPTISEDQGKEILAHMIVSTVDEFHKSKTHDFVYCFFPEDHPLVAPLREWSQFVVNWKARLWYWDASVKYDPSVSTELAYDPRDSLH
jgi:hypothetical protein